VNDVSPPSDRKPNTTRKRGVAVGGAAVVLAGTLALALTTGWFGSAAAAGDKGHGQAAVSSTSAKAKADSAHSKPVPEKTPPPLDIPAPGPQPLGDAKASASAADSAVAAVVTANNEILQRADGGTVGIDDVTAGFVRGELQALAAEREKLGYKQVGEAKIVSTTVRSVDLSASPPTVELGVCIDSSKVDIVDSNGKSLGDLLYKPGVPVLNVYGAQYLDGRWKIVTHDIPDGAPCA
jgi:hypothetical protein